MVITIVARLRFAAFAMIAIGALLAAQPAVSSPIPGGIPARCFAQVTSSDQFDAMTCNTAVDSTVSFTDGYIVPTGYYFMVTDISVGPFFTSGTPGTLYRGAVCERSEFSRSYCYEMRDTVPNWHSRHFTVPYVVIRPGRYPEGRNAGGTTTLEFQISGLLVTEAALP